MLSAADRKQQAQAEKAEIEVQRLRGELLSASDVNEIFGSVADAIRDGIETLERLNPENATLMVEALKEAGRRFAANYGSYEGISEAIATGRNGKA